MKTIEEKDDAILAELARLHQNNTSGLFFTAQYRNDLYRMWWGEDQERVIIEYVGRTSPNGFDPTNTERVYRLLGLSERDAVQSAKDEWKESTAKAIAHLNLETATANRDKLQAEKRNAALVAALEEIHTLATNNGEQKQWVRNAIGNTALKAIRAANEKGGKGE